jgi:hypothetical protein
VTVNGPDGPTAQLVFGIPVAGQLGVVAVR